MAQINDVANFYKSNYGSPSLSNGNYTLNGFRLGGTDPLSQQFNSALDAGNVNQAYSGLLGASGGIGGDALKAAWGGDPSTVHQIINSFSAGSPSYFGANGYDPKAAMTAGGFNTQGQWDPNAGMSSFGDAFKQRMGQRWDQIGNSAASANAAGIGAIGGQNATALTPGATAPATQSLSQVAGGGALGGGTPTMGSSGGALGGATMPGAQPAIGQPAAPLPGTGNTNYSQPLTDPSAFLNPSMAFTMKQGMDALQGSAAARGSLNSGQTLKDIAGYSQGLAGQNWQQAMNNANTDRNFRYGVDTGDRDFAYNSAVNDRNFNNGNDQFLVNAGLQGTNANSSLAGQLGALLSANGIAAGQAQAGGTVGSANSINQMISQLLNQYNSNNLLSQYGLNGVNGG